jgi:hypothetical protein
MEPGMLAERDLHLAVGAVRADGIGNAGRVEGVEHPAYAGNERRALREFGEHLLVDAIHPVGRKRGAEAAGFFGHAGHGAAEEERMDLADGEGKPVSAEARRDHTVGDGFAVDENAVAVEKDGRRSHAGAFRRVMIVSP